jgi:tRNA A37 threonylcarbamoyltransferase TsaD
LLRNRHRKSKKSSSSSSSSSSSTSTRSAPMPLIFPPINLCTDNGVMAGWTGIEKLLRGISDCPYSHGDDKGDGKKQNDVIARWSLGDVQIKSRVK